ncbi:hypothetical protein JTE90_018453 [Oedothorax gibbosus]|uniref:Uncharacterized protein n=1 Tax=Oedothorax gibbosus TaxID=931172 RepID=A0AAV6V002_9ARAC|nr:hypothetical protein JTE90_018453 [Oedothorax gibbosus]
MSGTSRFDYPPDFPDFPPMSNVRRIILDFENRRLLRAEFGLHSGLRLPVHSEQEVTFREDDDDLGFYDQIPDHVIYRSGNGTPKHVEREFLKRQHSLLFECNWKLEEEKPKKLSFKKKVKKLFAALSCKSKRTED